MSVSPQTGLNHVLVQIITYSTNMHSIKQKTKQFCVQRFKTILQSSQSQTEWSNFIQSRSGRKIRLQTDFVDSIVGSEVAVMEKSCFYHHVSTLPKNTKLYYINVITSFVVVTGCVFVHFFFCFVLSSFIQRIFFLLFIILFMKIISYNFYYYHYY